MYSLCGKIRSAYYLNVRNIRVRLISCLPDSNRNSTREFVQVSSNWHANELTCLTSPKEIGRYRAPLTCFKSMSWLVFKLLFEYVLTTSICHDAEGKRFRSNIRVVHMRDLNFMLRSEIFVNFDGQLRASHLILGCASVYTSYQPFGQALLVDSPLLSYIDVRHPNFLPPI